MANRSASRHGNRKKSGGKHRAKGQTPEVVTWLGAGAITLGLGAAMASGTGVANAEAGGESSTSTSASSTSSDADSNADRPSTTGSQSDSSDDKKPETKTASLSTNDDKDETTNRFPKQGRVDSRLLDVSDLASRPSTKMTRSSFSTIGVEKIELETQELQKQPVDEEPTLAAVLAIPVAPLREARVTSSASATVDSSFVETQQAQTAIEVGGGSVTGPLPGYTEAQWEAYLQKFRDADPEGVYIHPGAPHYPGEYLQTLSEGAYREVLAAEIAEHGARGFSVTSAGLLQYTNWRDSEVGIIYGPNPTFDVPAYYPPSGFVRVRAGETVVINDPAVRLAMVQLSVYDDPYDRYREIAALGYPPFDKTVQAPSGPSQRNVDEFTRGIISSFNATVGLFRSTLGSLIANGTDFVFNFAVPAIMEGWNKATKATFDGLSSMQKSVLLGQLADAADEGRKTITTVLRTLGGLASKVFVGFQVFAVAEAYQASQNAKSASDVVHAGISTAAANAPFAGAVTGYAIAGPPGAVLGFAIGGAAGLGLAIGNELTKVFGW